MRRLLALLLLAVVGVPPTDAAAQAPPDTVAVVAPGGLTYTAVVPSLDSVISVHSTAYKAQSAAENAARRLCLVTEVRLEGVTVLQLTPTCTLAAPGDSVIVDEPDDPAPDPEDPPVDPDEPDDPAPDPDPDPDPDPLPPPTLGTWNVTWTAPAGTNGANVSDPQGGRFEGGGNAGGRGESRVVDLPSPGPWGGSKALENFYGVTPAEWQPQVGTYWYFPQATREIWYETWVRFGDSWEIGPDNPLYPGNYDHKVHFVMVQRNQERFPYRWEWKVGVFGDLMSAAARDHDGGRYQYMQDPPRSGNRLRGPTDAWDGRWHHVRGHYRIDDANGVFRLWWDGRLVVDLQGVYTGEDNESFAAMLFGGNRNQGTDQPMSFFFGPAYVHTTDPGW